MPEMSVFYSHRERFRDPAGEGRSRAASLSERELLFHGGARDDGSLERHMQEVRGPDRDAEEFAQRPLVLADKWDF